MEWSEAKEARRGDKSLAAFFVAFDVALPIYPLTPPPLSHPILACPIASAAEASPIAFAAVEEVSAGFALPVVDDFTAAVVPDGSPELLQAFFLLIELSVSHYVPFVSLY